MGIVGKKRISRVANVTDQGLAVFAGLGKMSDPCFLHDFLDKVKTSDAEQFNIRCSRRFKEMGLKYVALLKLYQNRVEEMKSIPAGQFREMADGRQIAGNRAKQNFSNVCNKTCRILHCKLLKKRYWRGLR